MCFRTAISLPASNSCAGGAASASGDQLRVISSMSSASSSIIQSWEPLKKRSRNWSRSSARSPRWNPPAPGRRDPPRDREAPGSHRHAAREMNAPPDCLAEDRTGAASAASAVSRLHRAPVHRLQRNSRRSRVRRRRRHRLRHGPLPRRRSVDGRTQKGRDMKQRVHRNFGTPHPEGYRKAIRIMQTRRKI
jgi:hypothetical protein